MLQTFFHKISLIFSDASLRGKLLFTFGALVLFRVLAAIPIPGIDTTRLSEFFASNQFFGLLNVFSGGGLSNLSLVMLGVGPFITASIIMQLMTILSPQIKQMYQEEGEAGRKKFMQYARLLTVPLALIQGFGFLMLLQRQGVIDQLPPLEMATNLLIITAGSVLLMWIGELISEFGVGNGISLIIFAGIVAGVPSIVSQMAFTFTPADVPLYFGFAALAVVIIAGVVFITEAERPVPITYAKQSRGQRKQGGVSTYLPLRLNQAGVIPIIFALSLLLFPQMLVGMLSGVNIPVVQTVAGFIDTLYQNNWFYGAFYFVLVFGFTYFYTAITFDPDTIAQNLQKSGAFVPGVRPGTATSQYLATILTRLTLVGALFLGVIAVLPIVLRAILDRPSLAIGGTALLIVVVVIIDLIKRMDAQISMREY